MADITISVVLNDAEQATLQRLTDEQNARRIPPEANLTPVQFLRGYITQAWLGREARQHDDTQRLTMRDRYAKAAPEERAQIDAVLGKYA